MKPLLTIVEFLEETLGLSMLATTIIVASIIGLIAVLIMMIIKKIKE